MSNTFNDLIHLNLALFGDAAAAGGADGGDGGVTESAAETQTGVDTPAAEEMEAPEVDLDAEFDEMIKGKYKDVYGKRVSATVQSRLRGAKADRADLEAANGILAMIASKYNVNPTDYNALHRAVEADDSLLEDEALDRGVPTEQVRVERENKQLRQRLRQEAADKTTRQWMAEGEQLKAIFPAFDFAHEMRNPQFKAMLRSGVGVEAAYKALHNDEIMTGMMQVTAQKARNAAAMSMASGNRPSENGVSERQAVSAQSRVAAMSADQINALCEKAMRGESVKF